MKYKAIKELRKLGYRVSIKNSYIGEPWKNLITGKVEWRQICYSTAKPLSNKTLIEWYKAIIKF